MTTISANPPFTRCHSPSICAWQIPSAQPSTTISTQLLQSAASSCIWTHSPPPWWGYQFTSLVWRWFTIDTSRHFLPLQHYRLLSISARPTFWQSTLPSIWPPISIASEPYPSSVIIFYLISWVVLFWTNPLSLQPIHPPHPTKIWQTPSWDFGIARWYSPFTLYTSHHGTSSSWLYTWDYWYWENAIILCESYHVRLLYLTI